jgi:hypothetical protein
VVGQGRHSSSPAPTALFCSAASPARPKTEFHGPTFQEGARERAYEREDENTWKSFVDASPRAHSFTPARTTRLKTMVSYVTGDSTSVAIGDFNGDGLPDLAVTASPSNTVFILANDGIWDGPARRGRLVAPSEVVDRQPFTIAVLAVDGTGNTAGTLLGQVYFSSTDSGAVLAYDYRFTAADRAWRPLPSPSRPKEANSLESTTLACPGFGPPQPGMSTSVRRRQLWGPISSLGQPNPRT